MRAHGGVHVAVELGDVLFTVAQMARHLEFEPEQALRGANHKFESRFDIMMTLVAERKLDWTHLSNSEKESLWSEAKKHFKNKHEIIR